MTQKRKAQVLTGAALAVGLGIVAWRSGLVPSPAPKADPTPQDAIYAMLDAARAGDVRKYLASYTGQMETALKATVAEKSEPAFAQYLKEFNAPIKGVAIMEPQALSDLQARIAAALGPAYERYQTLMHG